MKTISKLPTCPTCGIELCPHCQKHPAVRSKLWMFDVFVCHYMPKRQIKFGPITLLLDDEKKEGVDTE